MYELALPALFAALVWWSSTGLIVFLDGLPRATFRWSMLGATVGLALGFYGLARTSADESIVGAYLAFGSAILVWGWHETSFLMGYVTGPRRTPCPEDSAGLRRAGHAFQTILHHELAIVVTLALAVALTAGGANQTGLWTLVALWALRISAKLNVFLGVPNLGEEFLPEHLRYLASYFRRGPMNLLFPVSITAATLAIILLGQAALAQGATAGEAAGLALVATLTALGLVEHWLMVLPVPAARLWGWSLGGRQARLPAVGMASATLSTAKAPAA